MGWKGGDTKLAATFSIQSDICAEICLTVGEKKKKKNLQIDVKHFIRIFLSCRQIAAILHNLESIQL